MAKATTTTYLEIESIGADKLISTMAGLQKSLNFVAGQLKDLNKGLGLSSTHAKKGAEAMNEQAQAAAQAAQQATQLRVAMAQQMATTADLAKTVKSLGDEQKKQSKALDWQAVASKVQLARQAYEAIKGALISVGQEAMRVAQAWEVQEAAEMKVAAAIQNKPLQGQLQAYKEWASAIQSATKYGDEQVLTLAAQAARMANSEAQTKATTKAALDWAAATGGQAEQALRAMGRAMSGNSESLRQLGLYLTEAEKQTLKQATEEERLALITDKLSQSYGGFAEALAATPTGALQQAQNILGDIDEQVGRLVSPALYAGLGVVQEYLQGQLDDLLKITDNAEALDNVQRDILGLLQAAGRTMIDLKTVLGVIKNSVEILAQALWTALAAPLKPIGMLFEQLAKLPGLGQETKRTMGDLAYAISGPFDMMVDGIKRDIKDIKALYAEGEKDKQAFEASTYKAFQNYQAMAKKRQEAAGLGGGPRTGDGESNRGGGTGRGAGTAPASPLPSQSQLDQELAQMEAYMAKMEALTAEFAAKRKALEDSQIIDAETKNAMRLQLETQEQEAERQLRLQYAQETGDQLTLLEDQYRQDRLAKEKAAQEQLQAEQKATMEALASNLKSVGNLGIDMLTGWIEGTGDWRAQLYDALKSFSKNLMTTAIAKIIDQALINQAEAQGSQAGIPIVGPILALAAGATMFATTMALKSKLKPAEVQYAQGGYISAGMVRGGSFGRDSVAALLEPGERVLSKKEAAAYDDRQASQNVVINLNISGQLSTPEQVRDTVRRVLLPEINTALKGGYRLAM